MHQKMFLTTPDSQKYLFWKKVSGGLGVCVNASEHVLITPDSKKYGGLEVCANASKHVFNHYRRSKISFLKKSFWWSGSMRKCIKTRF